MKVTYWILALIFFAFALVQYNDPDPLVWVPVYGIVAVLFVLAAIGRPARMVARVVCGITGIWAATYLPDFWHWLQMGAPSIVETMKAEKPYVELTREFLGLVLAMLACGWLGFGRR